MIVGGYLMDLYCRNGTDCAFIGKEYEDFPGGNKFVSDSASAAHIHGLSKADWVSSVPERTSKPGE